MTTRHWRYTRADVRRHWHEAGACWAGVPPVHRARNLTIARAYIETDEPTTAIAARHGLSRERVRVIAHTVIDLAIRGCPRRR